jgi:branched-chain amino acid transport system permease protein
MADLLNYLVSGALTGLLFALVALGFVVIYRASKVFNFAQGELLVLGGFLIWWLAGDLGLPSVAALALALVLAAACGFAIERLFFARLVGEPVFALIMMTVAVLVLLRGAILLLFGPAVRAFPAILPLQPLVVGDVYMPISLLVGGAVTIAAAAGFSWFFNRTGPGLTMSAVAEDHQIALSLGISVHRSVALAWVLGSLTSVIGALILFNGKAITLQASSIGFAALPVALLAGLESIGGLLLAGVAVGVIHGLVGGYLDPLVGGGASTVAPFLIMLAILYVRPSGLFGWRRIERI